MPARWVIVSDGSTDETDKILRQYEKRSDFIQFIRLDASRENKGFVSKVFALRKAYEMLGKGDYHFIGILDADVSFNSRYYENILNEFGKNNKLGISGGYIYEPDHQGIYRSRSHNRIRSVAGAVQMFRKECYEMMGGLQPIIYGGEDTYAEMLARASGWEVQAFPEYNVFHHKPGYLKRGVWNERFREGRLDYVLGTRAIYEFLKFIRRISESPFFLGACVRIIGYLEASITGKDKIPPPEIIQYIQKEQWNILINAVRNPKRKCW
jgi:glycosyltransferase involved in cell wall biosynthesis